MPPLDCSYLPHRSWSWLAGSALLRDEPLVGDKDPNTGGSVLYVSPRLLVKLDRTLFLRLGVQIPVVKNLFGDQDEKVNFLTGLTVRF